MNSKYLLGIAKLIIPLQFIVAIYFLLRGHNAPGGGFIGGLLFGVAITFNALITAESEEGFQKKLNSKVVILSGLLISVIAGVWGLLLNGVFLSGVWGPEIYIPLVGGVKLGSVFLFDIGVFVLVVGVVMELVILLRKELL